MRECSRERGKLEEEEREQSFRERKGLREKKGREEIRWGSEQREREGSLERDESLREFESVRGEQRDCVREKGRETLGERD